MNYMTLILNSFPEMLHASISFSSFAGDFSFSFLCALFLCFPIFALTEGSVTASSRLDGGLRSHQAWGRCKLGGSRVDAWGLAAACTVTRLRVKVVVLAVGCAVAAPGVGASGLAVAHVVAVPGAKASGQQKESVLWNSQEPMAGEARVPVSVGPQLRQQVLGQSGCRVPGSV